MEWWWKYLKFKNAQSIHHIQSIPVKTPRIPTAIEPPLYDSISSPIPRYLQQPHHFLSSSGSRKNRNRNLHETLYDAGRRPALRTIDFAPFAKQTTRFSSGIYLYDDVLCMGIDVQTLNIAFLNISNVSYLCMIV